MSSAILFDRWPRQCSHRVLSTGRNLIMVLLLAAVHTASAWTNGQLLIWMDADRASATQLAANRFEQDYGIPVRIETPEKITDNFPLAAQVGKGPDIVIWAHDKVGEWADGGVIAPIVDEGEVMPNIPQMGKFWLDMAAALETASSCRCGPAAALKDAQREMLKGIPGGRP
jgi:maltose-binding protein MalE